MTHRGWVGIYRKIQDHWLWEDKPFSKQAAWIDMLLLANHEDKKFLFGNELIEVKCGSFITSELKLAERWGWGRKKVRLFLELLQSDQMIVKQGDNKKTTINIVNYSIYSSYEPAKGTTEEHQRNSKGTAEEHQRNTNNNDNNYNNDNNKEKIYKKESRHKYGMYQNVLLSDVEMEKLKTEFPNDWEQRIERLSEYIASTGKSYKNHLATIRVWAKKDKPQKQANIQKSELEGVF